MRIDDLAARIGGTVEGNGSLAVTGLAALDEARAGDVSFLANPKYAGLMASTEATAVIVAADWSGPCPAVLIRAAKPDGAFAQAGALLSPPPPAYAPGVHATAVVAQDVVLGSGVSIGPYCVIQAGAAIGDRSVLVAHTYVGHGARLGSDCVLHAHVSVRERSWIGDRVIVHNGSVIGADGFGYSKQGEAWIKIPQVGVVEIGNDVEIGANVTIDRARFGRTMIADGVKIDNLVMVAHNCRIGAHTAMAAQVGISGSTRIGRNVQLGGQAGLAGHLEVGDGAVVGAQAGVTKDVEAGSFVVGFPAAPYREYFKLQAELRKVPELRAKVAEWEKRWAALEAGRAAGDGEKR